MHLKQTLFRTVHSQLNLLPDIQIRDGLENALFN